MQTKVAVEWLTVGFKLWWLYIYLQCQLFLQVFLDKACQREILCLQVYCNYRKSGCSWIGALKDLEVIICNK